MADVVTSVADELAKLAQLNASEFLSDEEFARQKDALLAASGDGSLSSSDLTADEMIKLADLVRADSLTRAEFDSLKAGLLWTVDEAPRGVPYEAETPSPIPTGWEWLLAIAGALVALGALLPWEQGSSGFASFSRNGFQLGNNLSFSPDGLIVLGLGIIAGLVGITRLTGHAFPRWLNGSPVILGGVILLETISDERSISSTVQSLQRQYPNASYSVSYGLWLAIVGGAVIALAGVMGWWGARRVGRLD